MRGFKIFCWMGLFCRPPPAVLVLEHDSSEKWKKKEKILHLIQSASNSFRFLYNYEKVHCQRAWGLTRERNCRVCCEVSETSEGFAQTLCEILNPQNAFVVRHHRHLADTFIQNPKIRRGWDLYTASIQAGMWAQWDMWKTRALKSDLRKSVSSDEASLLSSKLPLITLYVLMFYHEAENQWCIKHNGKIRTHTQISTGLKVPCTTLLSFLVPIIFTGFAQWLQMIPSGTKYVVGVMVLYTSPAPVCRNKFSAIISSCANKSNSNYS